MIKWILLHNLQDKIQNKQSFCLIFLRTYTLKLSQHIHWKVKYLSTKRIIIIRQKPYIFDHNKYFKVHRKNDKTRRNN